MLIDEIKKKTFNQKKIKKSIQRMRIKFERKKNK
jgi:hypothetical protein